MYEAVDQSGLTGFTLLFGRLSVAKEVLKLKYLDCFSYFSKAE